MTTIDKLREHVINLHLFGVIDGDARIEMQSLCNQAEAELKSCENRCNYLQEATESWRDKYNLEIADLKKQVEAMKCCGNCEYLICTGCTLDRYNCEINDRKYWKLKGGAK